MNGFGGGGGSGDRSGFDGFGGFRLGVNYWPRERGLRKWDDWDPEGIVRDLALLRELGLRYVRIFLLWPVFQPTPDAVSEAALSRLDDFLAIADRHGLKVIPTLFTGHMSGNDWDVSWRGDRSPYRDPALLRAQVRLVTVLARRYRGDQRVAAWDLANEPDVFVRPDTRDDGWLWTRLLAREFRAHDPTHPVTLGIHQASLLEDNGFRPADVAESVDFMCMHMYPFYTGACPDPLDSLRSGYSAAFAVRLTEGMAGMPVLAEEIGCSTLMHGEERAAGYLSTAVWSLLAAGATGALAWCFTDPARPDRSPYDENPYEAGFGLVDADGKPKAAGHAFGRIAAALSRLAPSVTAESGSANPGGASPPVRPVRPVLARTAVVIPSRYHDGPDPDLTPERHFRVLFNAFVLARQAGLAVDLLPAENLDRDALARYALVILPSLPRRGVLTVHHFAVLCRYVAEGGVLYASYDGAAFPGLADLFGADPEDSLLPESGHRSLVPGRDLPPGLPPAPDPAGLTCPVLPDRKALMVRAREATVLATEPSGAPALLYNRHGRGHALLATYPVELAVSFQPDAFRPGPAARGQGLYWIYEVAAHLAESEESNGEGLLRPVKGSDPWLEVSLLEFTGRSRLSAGDSARGTDRAVLLINHHPAAGTFDIALHPTAFPSWRMENGERSERINLYDLVSGIEVPLETPPDGSPESSPWILRLAVPGNSAALLVRRDHLSLSGDTSRRPRPPRPCPGSR